MVHSAAYSVIDINKLTEFLWWFEKKIGIDYEVEETDEEAIVTYFEINDAEIKKINRYLINHNAYIELVKEYT